jgi:hypothetical protein
MPCSSTWILTCAQFPAAPRKAQRRTCRSPLPLALCCSRRRHSQRQRRAGRLAYQCRNQGSGGSSRELTEARSLNERKILIVDPRRGVIGSITSYSPRARHRRRAARLARHGAHYGAAPQQESSNAGGDASAPRPSSSALDRGRPRWSSEIEPRRADLYGSLHDRRSPLQLTANHCSTFPRVVSVPGTV